MSKKCVVIICTILALLIIAALYFYSRHNTSEALAHNIPVFSYDKAKTKGWWSVGNINAQESVDPEQYDAQASGPINELPTASLTLHHGGPDDPEHTDRCFASLFYYSHPLKDIEAAYAEREQEMSKWGGSFEALDSKELTIKTHEGNKPYELRQYHTKTAMAGEYMSGVQVGFVALENGHIHIQGICQGPEYLNLTLPIIPSVSLRI